MNSSMGKAFTSERPATAALEASQRLQVDIARRGRARSPRSPVNPADVGFDMTDIFNEATLALQKQDNFQFPTIAWISDDEDTDDESSEDCSSRSLGSHCIPEDKDRECAKRPSPILCSVTVPSDRLPKRIKKDSHATGMVRSKSLYADLSLLPVDAIRTPAAA